MDLTLMLYSQKWLIKTEHVKLMNDNKQETTQNQYSETNNPPPPSKSFFGESF